MVAPSNTSCTRLSQAAETRLVPAHPKKAKGTHLFVLQHQSATAVCACACACCVVVGNFCGTADAGTTPTWDFVKLLKMGNAAETIDRAHTHTYRITSGTYRCLALGRDRRRPDPCREIVAAVSSRRRRTRPLLVCADPTVDLQAEAILPPLPPHYPVLHACTVTHLDRHHLPAVTSSQPALHDECARAVRLVSSPAELSCPSAPSLAH